jgi:hypothetical protein
VGGHVVRALEGVCEVVGAVRDGAVEPRGEVAAHVGRGVLIQGERRGRVLHEHRGDADRELRQLGHSVHDLVGHQVEAARPCAELDLAL